MTETQILHIIAICLIVIAILEILHFIAHLCMRFSLRNLFILIIVLCLNFVAIYGIYVTSFKNSWPSLLPFLLLVVSSIIYLSYLSVCKRKRLKVTKLDKPKNQRH